MEAGNTTRRLSVEQAATLEPGADYYRAYIGPPDQYDFMGASQFRLLTALGLRENHNLLDFGCGSLRAGRLFIPYLLPGRYFGLEPNKWLIDEGIDSELGRDILRVKRPTFRHDEDFRATQFGVQFDFILAQSIFSHTGGDLVTKVLAEFGACLNPAGLVLATFLHPHQLDGAPDFTGSGWVYPDCVAFEPATITRLMAQCGLVGAPLAWFHPRQTWYAMARTPEALPASVEDSGLSGAVRRSVVDGGILGALRRLRSFAARRARIVLGRSPVTQRGNTARQPPPRGDSNGKS